jgi:hypothetical protein
MSEPSTLPGGASCFCRDQPPITTRTTVAITVAVTVSTCVSFLLLGIGSKKITVTKKYPDPPSHRCVC